MSYLTDTFTDADNTVIESHVADDGHKWFHWTTRNTAGEMSIVGNELIATDVNNGSWKTNAYPVSNDVSATIVIDAKSLSSGISRGWWWILDENNGYLLLYNGGTSAYEMYAFVNGSFVGGAPVGSWSNSPSGPQTIIFAVNSNTATLTVGGTTQISYSNASLASNPRGRYIFGLWSNQSVDTSSTGFHIDSVICSELNLSADTKTYALVCDGDSLTFGLNLLYSQAYPFLISADKNTNAVWDFGIPSQTVATMAANAASKIDGVYPQTSGYTYRIASLLAGINDCLAGTAAATIEANIQSWWQGRKSAGYKVLGMTITPAASVTGANETIRQTVNTWIRANHATYCDYFADLDGDARLQDTSNTTYYQGDGTHYTATGQQVVQSLIEAALPAAPVGGSGGGLRGRSLPSVIGGKRLRGRDLP